MADTIQFETPENVQLSYSLAGQGTRFVAWVMDTLLISLVAFLTFIGIIVAGASLDIVSEVRGQNAAHSFLYLLAIFWLAYSFGNLLYFGSCELLLHGQTLGKRSMHIRVVKADGFSLDPTAIFLRTIFRIVDHIPVLFVVPLVTAKYQRLGDLVAGTIVVVDEQRELSSNYDQLASGEKSISQFQFDIGSLKRARQQDVQAVERILERWSNISEEQRQSLLERIVPPLAARLNVECPPAADWLTFLRDFLAAEYRRQHRRLG